MNSNSGGGGGGGGSGLLAEKPLPYFRLTDLFDSWFSWLNKLRRALLMVLSPNNEEAASKKDTPYSRIE